MDKHNIRVVGDACSGCSACVGICPTKAIAMKENEEGFLYPQVDEAQCIRCGLCRKACPVLSVAHNPKPVAGYAAYLLDADVLRKSTSGGVFSAIAQWCLENGGVVYGCAYVDGIPKHMAAHNAAELVALRGSKYVQSEMGDVYEHVKADLDRCVPVVFSGTPVRSPA